MSGASAARAAERLYARIGGLGSAARRRAFLTKHRGLARKEAVARLSDLASEKVWVDPRQSLAVAEFAELVARKLRDDEALAHGLRAKGNALRFLDDHRAAIAHHSEAARLFGRAGLPTEVGRTLSTSIQPLILLGEYAQAEQAAARAREIFARERNDLRLARLDLNVGNIYHRQDRFDEALRYYEQAYERLLALRDVEGIAVALGNMAMCLITLNQFQRARDTHGRAKEWSEAHGLPKLVALADYNIAYLDFFRGQYGRAIEALKRTRAACEAIGDRYLAALCRLDLAEIYLELNLSPEAAEMAAESHDAFQALGNRYEAAKAVGFQAIAHGQQGKVLRALELLARARARFASEHNAVWPALLDLYQALLLFAAGRLFEARRGAAAALDAFPPAAASKAILCRLLLARIALRLGDVAEARAACGRAAESLAFLDLPALRFQMHAVKGQIEQAAGEHAAAFEAFRAALACLESLRSSLRGEELKIAFLKNKLEVHEQLVDLSLRRGGPGAAEAAFGYAEQAKSRVLQELILRGAAPVRESAAGKSDLVRRVGELREELNWYYHRIEAEQMAAEEHTAERVERLQAEVSAHEKELLRALRELPDADRGERELLTPVTLPLEEIRRALPAGATLVEYFTVGGRLLAFLLTRERLEVVPVGLLARVQHVLRLLQFQLGWGRPGARGAGGGPEQPLLEATRAHLGELYQALVAPLRGHLDAAHLVIVPHGPLHYVPFHALFDGERHLIDSVAVSYAPSASVYALCERRRPRASGASLVLAVPDPLNPAIAEEARAVAARLPGAELFVGEEASADVLRTRGPLSRFVHVAAHGVFRGDNPMFSGVRLGGSYLTLYDLYALSLPADLVSLSACVTGRSVVAAGDELLGLARGLFRAGAASLLLTLWEVPDQSTAAFMTAFFDGYFKTQNAATAYRDAVLATREDYPHPVHWAPFVLSGKVLRT
jgi:tetratricopeptide (TPR) repeat protein